MVTSLRAVGELQNPAIRDRHWFQLMQATQVKFIMSDETKLADLLALNLHMFEEEVRHILPCLHFTLHSLKQGEPVFVVVSIICSRVYLYRP